MARNPPLAISAPGDSPRAYSPLHFLHRFLLRLPGWADHYGALDKIPLPYFNVLLLPILAGTLDALGLFLEAKLGLRWLSVLGGVPDTVAYVLACLGLSIGVYGSFVVDIITNLCDYLDIWCLSIRHPYIPHAPEEKVERYSLPKSSIIKPRIHTFIQYHLLPTPEGKVLLSYNTTNVLPS